MSDDEHPTLEEAQASNKKKYGDNVVPLPKKEEPIEREDIIEKMNKYYATVIMDGKFKVINRSLPDSTIFMTKKDFQDSLAHEKMLIQGQTPKGDVTAKYEPVTKYWLEHPKHRQFGKVVFDPRKPFDWDHDKDFNLFEGFKIKPKKGQCYKTLMYVRNILCNGNKEHFRWHMAWCAQMVQEPWIKPETAIAIQGEEEGTGKSFFPSILAKLLDGKEYNSTHKLYFAASNPKMITGDFSGHLERCLLLHAEEAFRAESEREDSIIKNLISDENLSINAKNIEAKLARNYIRLILTGNPPHIVKAGRFARRFLVLKISSKHRMDTEYFKELSDELYNGGFEALMYYLMHYPINKFNLRVILKTEALLEQKLESMKGEERFWYNMLYTGELPFMGTTIGKYYEGNNTEYLVIKYKLFNFYQRFMNKKVGKDRSDEVSFGKRFGKFFPLLDGDDKIRLDRTGAPMKMLLSAKPNDVNVYIIPRLVVARKLFDIYLGQACEWPDNEDWIEKEYGDA